MTGIPRLFWRLYASSATSNLADGIGRAALPLLGASFTRNPVLISGLTGFAFLPWLLFALPSGALVDRVDRRFAMAAANAVRAATTCCLAVLVLTGDGSIAVVYLAAFLLGLAETVYDSASRAILPQVVDARDLDRTNGLLTVEETLGQTFIGAPVGSVLFAVAASLPFGINASGFAVAAVLVLTLRGNYRPRRAAETTSLRRDIGDGVGWLRRHRFLRSLTAISATTSGVQSMTSGVFVLYVLEVLHLPARDYGVMFFVAGIGALIGGTATPLLARHIARGPLLVTGGVVGAVATGVMGLVHNGIVAAALFAADAAGVMVWNVLTMSLRQALIPEQLFGRVQGAYRTLVWGAIPIGSVLGGVLADSIGIGPVFVVAGVGLALAQCWLARVVRVHRTLLADPRPETVDQVEYAARAPHSAHT